MDPEVDALPCLLEGVSKLGSPFTRGHTHSQHQQGQAGRAGPHEDGPGRRSMRAPSPGSENPVLSWNSFCCGIVTSDLARTSSQLLALLYHPLYGSLRFITRGLPHSQASNRLLHSLSAALRFSLLRSLLHLPSSRISVHRHQGAS